MKVKNEELKIGFMLKVLCFISFLSTFQLLACSCWGKSGIESNDNVFIGKVLNIEIVNGYKQVIFYVEKIYKGNYKKNHKITLKTGITSANCGFNFKKRLTYAVYSNNGSESWNIGRCSRTRLLFPFQKFIYGAKKATVASSI